MAMKYHFGYVNFVWHDLCYYELPIIRMQNPSSPGPLDVPYNEIGTLYVPTQVWPCNIISPMMRLHLLSCAHTRLWHVT